ncbi:17157_t:CDS:2 [Cetraspora pellucida]|uniref:17157_t:CDS:1 n=1 Tax=Cetraspora pellucida TaxID=1433469 RepID=A0A9N9AVH2_9GLOM|nr:17157_t:CDS:2 [Cetraspora pellucida]
MVVNQQLFLLAENTEFNNFLIELELVTDFYFGQKLLGIMTNNATNMLVMGCILREKINSEFGNQTVQHFYYGVHVLNIVVEEEIKSISIEISKAQKFSMKLRNSSLLIYKLKKNFEMKNIPFLMPETNINIK